jgi:tol-pal system protein YbgF
MRLRHLTPIAVLFAATLASLPARSGLFDDDEARNSIADLKIRVEANRKAVEERLTQIEAAGNEAAAQGRRAIVDLASMIDGLKQDIAKLTGQSEVLLNQAENLERRQKDLYGELDMRLRKLEQSQSRLEQTQSRLDQTQTQIQDKLAQPERDAAQEKQAYETALNQFKVGNYQAAIAAFQTFMVNYTNSSLVPSAQYWVGNSYYALREYKVAIAAQEKVLSLWPDNAKAPDALLNIASSQAELGDVKTARETLKILVTKYPQSQAAEQAKQRLGGRR